MKQLLQLAGLLIILLTFSCQTEKHIITLQNPLGIERTDEPVMVKRTDIERVLGEIPEDKTIVVLENDTPIPLQLDDMNQDGEWDEAFLLLSFEPNEKKELIIDFTDSLSRSEKIRTNIRFASSTPPYPELTDVQRLKTIESPISAAAFQMEGPSWENDKVAFRNYFDARNGMDIYGKRVPEMILDGVGINGQKYHELDDWGMDILKVGNSLGAGSIALKIGEKIYRVDSAQDAGIQIISEGPLRSVFVLYFKGWQAAGNSYDIDHRISIWGGARCYKSEVTISGLHGEESLVTGIVNMHSDSLYTLNNDSDYAAIFTHDNQAFDGEKLGMGIVYHSVQALGTVKAPEEGDGIVQTYMLELKAENEVPVPFYFYVGWELENIDFKEVEAFEGFLKGELQLLDNPVSVGIE